MIRFVLINADFDCVASKLPEIRTILHSSLRAALSQRLLD
jgi:hypothetical protein